jgi:hypothetical protein
MKKLYLLIITWLVFATSQAQWVNNPATNTLLASCDEDATEIILATDPETGDTYVQWMQFDSNGWSPNIQRITQDGAPQWGHEGIHIGGQQFASYSEGVAMAALSGGGVVSCFADYEGHTYAVKINADGTFPWGAQGKQLFGGQGFSRTELLAGTDGGVWALGSDYDATYLCYIEADGTQKPTITLSDVGKSIIFSQMLPNSDNAVFVIYESCLWAYSYYYEKELWVVSYTKEGNQVAPPVRLMAPQTIPGSYYHYVVPDGEGGGYAYLWHAASGSFNTYVFHFDANGVSTIEDINGATVHSDDPENYFLDAYASVDPASHDLFIAYQQTDAASQHECKIYVNRISPTGERLWGDGKVLYDSGTIPCSSLRIDVFEDHSGFSLIFEKGADANGYYTTTEAMGFDLGGTALWTTQLSSNACPKAFCQTSTGFHSGQNIVTWVNVNESALYGQNLLPNGMMGPIPTGCPGPTGFQGEYQYNPEDGSFGALLTWDQPEEEVEFYRIYCTDLGTGEMKEVEIGGADNFYFDPAPIGRFNYQLRAMWAYLDCGLSLPATTPDGQDHVSVTVTAISEASEAPMTTILGIYTLTGQRLQADRLETLSPGVYVLEGLTADGKRIHHKIAVTQE